MTSIEWATLGLPSGASWNPVRARRSGTQRVGWHCEKVSPGCENCYSERQNIACARGGTRLPFKPGHRAGVTIYLDETTLLEPLHWRAPRGVFVCSMTDLFGDWVPDEWIDKVFAVAALCPQHRFAVLTKHSKRMREYFSGEKATRQVAAAVDLLARELAAGAWLWPGWPLPNLWLLVSAEDQARADERILDLLATPAAVRGVSVEPMLGPVDLAEAMITDAGLRALFANLERGDGRDGRGSLHWVICGGESGPGARPINPAWARSLAQQCREAGVAIFIKQLHVDERLAKDIERFPEDLRIREFPNAT